jgi:hypothetical protein
MVRRRFVIDPAADDDADGHLVSHRIDTVRHCQAKPVAARGSGGKSRLD